MGTYGQRKASRASNEGRGGKIVLAVLAGILIGLLLAVGVAFYVSNMSLPFTKHDAADDKLIVLESEQKLPTMLSGGEMVVAPPETPIEAAPTEEVVGTEAVPTAAATMADNADAAQAPIMVADTQRVPEQKTSVAKTPASDPELVVPQKEQYDFYDVLPRSDSSGNSAMTMQTPKPQKSNDRFFVQAGAFKSAKDADNLKARLALIGVEASIHTVIDPQKSTLHRVRIGPFRSQTEAEDALRQLSDSAGNTSPSIIKVPGV